MKSKRKGKGFTFHMQLILNINREPLNRSDWILRNLTCQWWTSTFIPLKSRTLCDTSYGIQFSFKQKWITAQMSTKLKFAWQLSQQNLHAKYSSKYLFAVCLTMLLNDWKPVNDLRRLWKETTMVYCTTLHFLERLKTITKTLSHNSRCFGRDSNQEFPNTSQKRHYFNHLVP
jgi:hypothetical protein